MKLLKALVLLVASFLKFGQCEEDSLEFEDPKRCSLSYNETFSWAVLGCVKCQWNQEEAPDYCPCPVGTSLIAQEGENRPKCRKCQENMMLYDNKNCIKCGSFNPFSLTLGKCSPCPRGHIEVAYNDDGSLKESLECVKCFEGYHPSETVDMCIPCHPSFIKGDTDNGTCQCPEQTHGMYGGICFTNQELSDPSFDAKSAYRIEYDGFKVESQLFREHLGASFYLCKAKRNQTACQMLANMCTLNLQTYSEEWSACRLYRTAISGLVSHPPNYIPKLYYSDVEAPSVLIRSTTIPHTHDMRYNHPTSDVNITLAKFSFTGQFLGLGELEEVIPCREPKALLRLGRKFGTNFRASCEMGLRDVWNMFNGKAIFLDPYVSYEEMKGKSLRKHLHPVPIKIQNFKRNGVKVNMLDDKYQWQLVRRFFIIDTIGSGTASDELDGAETDGKSIRTVRYLKSLHVRIQLQNSHEPGKIYVPLLTLSYAEATEEDLRRDTAITFDYSVDYTMDMTRPIEDVKIALGVLSAIVVLWSAIQAWSWNRRNGQVEIDLTTIANLLITSCGNLADTFFMVCFCTSLFWFALFKKQAAVHAFLPDSFQERLIRDMLITAFSLKIVAILELIRKQCTVDIFFVDWERPKVRNVIAARHPQEGLEKEKMNEESVSIWRTYFIANEWNEIQTTRKVHMGSQLMATILFLEVLGFKYWGLQTPHDSLDMDAHIVKHVPYSTCARFVTLTIIFGLIGIVQWMYKIGFHERYVNNKIQDFVDLCTMGNISVFILAAKQYGFYIHGRSVHGFADTDMQTMIEQLQREEEDLCGRRGLLPQTDQQTFLISVPAVFRTVYNQVLQPLYASSSSSASLFSKGRGSKPPVGSSGTGPGSKATPTMLNLSVHAYHSMNRFLTAFLEHALSDLDYDIMRKTFFESLLDMEFHEIGSDRAVFYTDDGHSFDSVLFYGHERTLFLFNLYIFIFVDILSHNFLLAAVVVFIVDMILKWIRNFLGKRNLARKTLIDARFLI